MTCVDNHRDSAKIPSKTSYKVTEQGPREQDGSRFATVQLSDVQRHSPDRIGFAASPKCIRVCRNTSSTTISNLVIGLPSEAWLASQMGVGRPLIREALSGLEAVGLIETRKGVGRFVKARAVESYLGHLTSDFLIRSFSVKDLAETRCLLEIAAVSGAVEQLTDEDCAQVLAYLEDMRASYCKGIFGHRCRYRHAPGHHEPRRQHHHRRLARCGLFAHRQSRPGSATNRRPDASGSDRA